MKKLEITEYEAFVLLELMKPYDKFIDSASEKEHQIIKVNENGTEKDVQYVSLYAIRKKLRNFVGMEI